MNDCRREFLLILFYQPLYNIRPNGVLDAVVRQWKGGGGGWKVCDIDSGKSQMGSCAPGSIDVPNYLPLYCISPGR